MATSFTTALDRSADKRDERGASAVEYGLLIAGIAALIVVAVFALGPVVRDAFVGTKTSICNGASGNAGCTTGTTSGS